MCLSNWSKHKQISFFNIRLFDGTEIQGQKKKYIYIYLFLLS